MDRSTKKLFRKLSGSYISDVRLATFDTKKYLLLNVVDKKHRLLSFSFLLETPVMKVELNMPSVDEVDNVIDMPGFMGTEMGEVTAEGSDVLLCTSDNDCLLIDLTNKTCDVVNHNEGRNILMTFKHNKSGF